MTKKEKIVNFFESLEDTDWLKTPNALADKILSFKDDALSELEIVDVVEGTGREVQKGDTVKIHYTGKLGNGTVFDSSYDRHDPLRVTIGVGQVIRGWDEGILGLRVGGKRTLSIPSRLGYGALSVGMGMIPAHSDLFFDVELLEIL